jgi:diguanylate cyclase (GGDEF)-like protein
VAPAAESAAGASPSRTVVAYAMTVFLLGAAVLLTVMVLQLPDIPWTSWRMSTTYLLTILLFIGELRPLLVARGDGDTDRVTVSSTFALALVLTGPLFLAIVSQVLATGLDDFRKRRPPLVCAFNAGQYALTLAGARLVFAFAADVPVTGVETTFTRQEILPSLVAAVTFFVVNNGTVGGVVALNSGQRVLAVLREDIRVQGMASAILLGLAPITAVVGSFSLIMVPLMMLPLLGVQHNAWIAAQRQHEALHDGLTGLPNRELFRHRVERAIAGTRNGTAAVVAVMLLDLDHFKEVNDTLGHQVGDGLLREVAGRLIAAVPDEITVARLGGDEFAILVPAAAGVPAVTALAERVAGRLREPVVAEGVRIGVQASIGIALCPEHASTVQTLLQRADIALYRAKTNRGEIQLYRAEIDQHTVLRLSLLGDLHTAVDNEEFELLYQPQVDTTNGSVVAIEALMRWRHPAHGVISPDVFIPLAENTGVIAAMSRNAMESALATLALLRAGGHDLSMAVNVSARLLSDLELPRWISQMLLAASVPPGRLTIEVTESTITADPVRAMQVLHDLREIGVRLAVDDFGTGYSSLSYLRRLQPDELKVDKSFVLQMGADENSAVIVRSTVELGHGLGLSVVAEGVEDQDTYDALARLGADRIQGFHIARPMSGAALKSWLDAAVLRGTALPVVDAPAPEAAPSLEGVPTQQGEREFEDESRRALT